MLCALMLHPYNTFCLLVYTNSGRIGECYLSSLNYFTFQKNCKYQVMYAKLNDYYYVINNIFIVHFLVPKYSWHKIMFNKIIIHFTIIYIKCSCIYCVAIYRSVFVLNVLNLCTLSFRVITTFIIVLYRLLFKFLQCSS